MYLPHGGGGVGGGGVVATVVAGGVGGDGGGRVHAHVRGAEAESVHERVYGHVPAQDSGTPFAGAT